MKMIKIDTMILLTTFGIVSSCVTIPNSPIYEVNFQFNRCKTSCYDWNELKTVKDSKCGPDYVSGNYPVEFCTKITGPKIYFFAKELKPAVKYNKTVCEEKLDFD